MTPILLMIMKIKQIKIN